MAAVSPSDAWAVGSFGNSVCSTAATVILRWNGTACAPNCGGHVRTLIVRWNGTAWTVSSG